VLTAAALKIGRTVDEFVVLERDAERQEASACADPGSCDCRMRTSRTDCGPSDAPR
jgi:hypothetical protein